MRQRLSRLLPAALLGPLRERQHKVYPTWEDAGQGDHSYNATRINAFLIERQILARSEPRRPPNLVAFTASALGLPMADIVDFGGGTGDNGEHLLSAAPDTRYTVVENPTLVAMAQERLGPGVRFVASMPESCDIFYTSCTLQYVSDYRAILAAGFRAAKRACVFVRNSFCDETIIRRQRSPLFAHGHGALPPGYANETFFYPHQTVREGDLMQAAAEAGFRLAYRSPHDIDGVLPYKGRVYGAQLVFLRN